MLTEQEIIDGLLHEIRIISGRTANPDPEKSLVENGINSMGFMELLLAAESRWHVSLIDRGITARDVASVRSLAEKILAEQPGGR